MDASSTSSRPSLAARSNERSTAGTTQIAALGREFDELIGRGRVALVGEAAQLIDVAQFSGQLDQFIDRIPVTSLSPQPKDRQF